MSHPKFLQRAERRLNGLQRHISRKKRGSENRRKARQRVATLHAKVTRQRRDFNHKLSNRLVERHDFIGFEDLNIRKMVRNHHLAKSIRDAGWNQLVTFTEYKALDRGTLVVRVDPAYSTKECFFCGVLNDVSLGAKEFRCVGCGEMLMRDQNAARVVLKRALVRIGQGMPELKPVETRPLPVQTTERASQVAEAGTQGLVRDSVGVSHNSETR